MFVSIIIFLGFAIGFDELSNSNPGVYVITNELYEPLHLYKIGYTCKLKDRLSELNVASAYDFRPVFVVPTKKCRQLESILHSKYEGHRVRREFFTLNEDNFTELIKMCSDFLISNKMC
ncbi:Bro4 [Heliothis virescens ascovirus 3j]|uniref:Bro4 n=1 Tax=Heliothis virescens ascovirus 3j TaxID=1561067 RepID=A0A2Z5UZC3_9VIRU|nr:Bro4 [Heliothis virescens ascovirus 3j]